MLSLMILGSVLAAATGVGALIAEIQHRMRRITPLTGNQRGRLTCEARNWSDSKEALRLPQ